MRRRFIVLKAIAFEHRNERKDSADSFHVLRYADEPEALTTAFAQRWVSGLHNEAVERAVAVLKTRLVDGDGVRGCERDGSVACARFALGNRGANALAIYPREVGGTVTEFLALVEAHRIR